MVDSVRMLVNVNESNVCYKCRNDSNGWQCVNESNVCHIGMILMVIDSMRRILVNA